MATGPTSGVWRRIALAIVALYTVFLAADPFGHHDLICHLRTPLHCTSCAASPIGPDPQPPAVPSSWHLADAGRAVPIIVVAKSALLAVRSTGRSPPLA